MSRWQPPHPAKTIVTKNENIRDHEPSKTSGRRCCWPGCYNRDLWLKLPLCQDHISEVYSRRAEQHQREWAVLENQRAKREKAEREELKAKALAAKRASQEAIRGEQIVYYVLVGQHIKIGFTKNVERRMRAYPPDSVVLGIEYGGKDVEHARHQQFEAHRALGREWFTDCDEIRQHIARHCMKWAPSTKPGIGPAGPRRAKVSPRYGSWDTRWKAS